MRLATVIAIAAGLGPAALSAPPAGAGGGPPPAGALAELRHSFTLGGAPVPPLVFRDMGDGDAADAVPALVAVDAWAAICGNRYADAVGVRDGLVTQTARVPGGAGTDTESYRYLGATPDGLMVLVTANAASEANYAPSTLHVVDAAVARALDADGRPYDRVVVTVLAGYPLGDGWRGRATLEGDTVTVVTEGGAMRAPGAGGDIRTYRIARP